MAQHPVFLSVVVAVRNRAAELRRILSGVDAVVSSLASDYEVVVVDNASDDDSVAVLKSLVGDDGLPNLQVYALTKEVDAETASWVGLENALGDFVAVFDAGTDDIAFLASMLDRAVAGADVVFASNAHKPPQSLAYRFCSFGFNLLYRPFGGIDLEKDAPQYRVLSRRVVNFVLQHGQPVVAYRLLPATAGFARAHLAYSAPLRGARKKRLGDSVDRGVRLLLSTTRAPMRLVTALSLFGAVSNLVYSAYVIAVAMLKEDVAPGWTTLSLQQSGMFFLISLVLLVLGEYILHMARLSGEGPLYHVGQEFTSARMVGREKLNVEDAHGHSGRRETRPRQPA
jgi:Glycosyl transferase family 2